MSDFAKLEKIIGTSFNDLTLLETAVTHRSYLNEHLGYKNPSNERMEFLGDSVLQFLTSEYLYRSYKKAPEGDLTNYRAAVVNTKSLAKEALRLHYGQFLLLSKGEEDSGGRRREYILANTFEAVLGALYLDQGIQTCRQFLKRELFYKIDTIIKEEKYKDFKSTFQELAQEKAGVTPIYSVLKEWGPDHDKRFRVGVFLSKKGYGQGEGSSKQEAEQEAARNALDKFKV